MEMGWNETSGNSCGIVRSRLQPPRKIMKLLPKLILFTVFTLLVATYSRSQTNVQTSAQPQSAQPPVASAALSR